MAKSTVQKTDPIGDALHTVGAGAQIETNAPKSETIRHTPQPAVTGAPAGKGEDRPRRRLGLPRMQYRKYLHQEFDATVERGTTVADIKDPHFWSNVAQQFRPMDHIIVTAEDGTWGAYLRVISCDRTWARVHVESFHDYTADAAATPLRQMDEYDIRWTTLGQWAVIKKGNDGTPPIKENFSTQIEAYQWLTEYLRDVANAK